MAEKALTHASLLFYVSLIISLPIIYHQVWHLGIKMCEQGPSLPHLKIKPSRMNTTTNDTFALGALSNLSNCGNLDNLYPPSNLSNITNLNNLLDLNDLDLINDPENFTNVANYTIEVPEVSVAERIVSFVVWALTNSIGNGMLIGIVQFERFGGDPLKRRVTDQVSHSKSLNRPNGPNQKISNFQNFSCFRTY